MAAAGKDLDAGPRHQPAQPLPVPGLNLAPRDEQVVDLRGADLGEHCLDVHGERVRRPAGDIRAPRPLPAVRGQRSVRSETVPADLVCDPRAGRGGRFRPQPLVHVDDSARRVAGGVRGGDDRGHGVPHHDRRVQPRPPDGLVHRRQDAIDVVPRQRRRAAMTRQVQGEHLPSGIGHAQLREHRLPRAAVEGRAVQQDQRRAAVGPALEDVCLPGDAPACFAHARIETVTALCDQRTNVSRMPHCPASPARISLRILAAYTAPHGGGAGG